MDKKTKSCFYETHEILQSGRFIKALKDYSSKSQKCEEALFCLESIKAFKKIDSLDELKDKAGNIYSLFLKEGVSFYDFPIKDRELRQELDEKEKFIQTGSKVELKSMFDGLENYCIEMVEKELMEGFINTKEFKKIEKWYKKNRFKEYPKFLRFPENWNQKTEESDSINVKSSSDSMEEDTNKVQLSSEDDSAAMKKAVNASKESSAHSVYPHIEEANLFDPKTKKYYIDLHNPHFTEKDLERTLNEYKDIEGWKKIYQKGSCLLYMEKDFSFIENPKRKQNRLKHIGVIDHNIEDVLGAIKDDKYMCVNEPSYIETHVFNEEEFEKYAVRNDFCCTTFMWGLSKFPWPKKNRSAELAFTVLEVDEGNIIVALVKSGKHPKVPTYPNTDSATVCGYWVLEKLDENKTRYYQTVAMDFHGWLPTKFFTDLTKKAPDRHHLICQTIQERKTLGLQRPWFVQKMIDFNKEMMKRKQKKNDEEK